MTQYWLLVERCISNIIIISLLKIGKMLPLVFYLQEIASYNCGCLKFVLLDFYRLL